jgi:hypothetical protein
VSIKPIDQPLPGEQVVALSPESAAGSRRALARATQSVLRSRAHRADIAAPAALAGWPTRSARQTLTAGIVHGFEVGHELLSPGAKASRWRRLTIAAGLGLAASGEDVVLTRPVELDLRQLPVFAEPSVEVGLPDVPVAEEAPQPRLPPPPPDPSAGRRGRRRRSRRRRNRARPRLSAPAAWPLFAAAPNAIARIGVLVLQPTEVDRLGEFDPTDPCELYPCGEAGDNSSFEDWRLADGVRLA